MWQDHYSRSRIPVGRILRTVQRPSVKLQSIVKLDASCGLGPYPPLVLLRPPREAQHLLAVAELLLRGRDRRPERLPRLRFGAAAAHMSRKRGDKRATRNFSVENNFEAALFSA